MYTGHSLLSRERLPGTHPGDDGKPATVYQGEAFFGGLVLQAIGAQGYILYKYTWTFPSGAIKGYGLFSTSQGAKTSDGTPGPSYTKFTDGPTTGATMSPDQYPFTDDDLNFDYSKTNSFEEHVTDKFYWGPEATGIKTVSLDATYALLDGNGKVVDSFEGTDSEQFNVIQTTGTIDKQQFRTAGLSTQSNAMGNYYIGLDRDSGVTSGRARTIGIQYSAQITSATPGRFTVVQTKSGTESLKGSDWTNTNTDLTRDFYLDPATGSRMIDPATHMVMSLTTNPALDIIGLSPGIGYGFRINTPEVGPGAPPANNVSATVFKNGGGTNVLWGSDSPRTELTLPGDTWVNALWTRSESYTLTLMYNPNPNATGGFGAGVGETIWVPVGSQTWSWHTTVSFAKFGGSATPYWVENDAGQDPGSYAATTQYPVWDTSVLNNSGLNRWWDNLANKWYGS